MVVAHRDHRDATLTVEVSGDTRRRVELALGPQPFTVAATPADAVVSFIGIAEDYVAGMRLPPGEYRIRVSAEGYETWERSVRHSTDPSRVEVALERSIETFSDALASGGSGPEMVVIPAGSFRMGCVSGPDCLVDEKPVREVRIGADFALSRHEVTFAEWDACAAAGGCGGYRPNDWGWGRGSRPVINASWNDARAYASWLSRETGRRYRLPSESEWEYAARSGTATRYFWGNEIGRNRANCDGCGSRWDNDRTAPVGSFAPNAFGLYDMHGNVQEWVEDCWNGSYTGAPTDGAAWLRGDCGRRVLRGGAWNNYPWLLRAALRLWFAPDLRSNYVGFRVARTLTP